jgi:glycosyltransferase involved in cell wall biosynthesis
MRLALVTDAWMPQTNGVVRTLMRTRDELTAMGHAVAVISPDLFNGFPCPTYPEIKLALLPGRKIARSMAEYRPDAIHIATEGPLGHAARSYCLRKGLPFTTAYHTRFPEYVAARFAVPVELSYAWLRRFHAQARSIMVATPSIESDLVSRGFANIRLWSRGVDLDLFKPQDKALYDLPRPIHLFVGRVAIEKNIEAFLALDLPGSQVVIGDGPLLAQLRRRFPKAHFLGKKVGEDLERHYAAADVFVFPSLTDTFGLVILEALARRRPRRGLSGAGPARHPRRQRRRRLEPGSRRRSEASACPAGGPLPRRRRAVLLESRNRAVPRQPGAVRGGLSAHCCLPTTNHAPIPLGRGLRDSSPTMTSRRNDKRTSFDRGSSACRNTFCSVSIRSGLRPFC